MTVSDPTAVDTTSEKPALVGLTPKIGSDEAPHASTERSTVMLNPSTGDDPGKERLALIMDKLIKERFSCRFFLPREVPRSTIEQLIDAARFAPSGNNIQPWEKVYCLTGSKLSLVSADMLNAFLMEPQAHKSQYEYYPPLAEMPAPYGERRQNFGKALGMTLGLDRMDVKRRVEAASRNYQFYGAPMALILTINKGLRQGSWLDVGYFLQSITLGARARGMETVTQESPSQYQAVLRKHLPISDDEIVAVCMCIGYPDMELVKKYQMPHERRDVGDILAFFD